MPELIFDDYVTLDDGRRSAVGHHHDSGRDDNAASRPSQPTPPAATTIQRYWAASASTSSTRRPRPPAVRQSAPGRHSPRPTTTLSSPSSAATASWESPTMSCPDGSNTWISPASPGPTRCWYHPSSSSPITDALVATGATFSMRCTQIPWDAPLPRRPFQTTRHFPADYPDFT